MAEPARQDPPTISTHVLDAEHGQPAVGVHVALYKLGEDDRPIRLTQAMTDADGRIRDLLERPMSPGDYRLEFSLAGPLGNSPADGGEAHRMGAGSSGGCRSTCGSPTRRGATTCRCSCRRSR